MNYKLRFIFMIALTTIALNYACNTANTSKKPATDQTKNDTTVYLSKGYELMQQKCSVCHMEKPDPSKKASMLAPPMIKIKEHYLPSFQSKQEFVDAVVAFVSNPTDEQVLMPGAVRRFKIMPNLGIADEDIKIIAEAIYDTKFGSMPNMKKGNKLSLNDGEKWKLKPESIEKINSIIDELNNFQSDDVTEYNKLGTRIFDTAKQLLLNKDYEGDKIDQLHYWFGNLEGSIHDLEANKSLTECQSIVKDMKVKFATFNDYFE